jgi:hypothetical protein
MNNRSNAHADNQRRGERASWPDPVTVRCLGGFQDGNLKPFFDDLGQNFKIEHNETRELPLWLLERCISSGGRFERVYDE